MLREAVAAVALALSMTAAFAADLAPDAIEEATYAAGDPLPSADEQSPLVFKLQALLDRAGISPGIIDGYYGMNVEVAIRTFAEREGRTATELDEEVWDRLGGNDTEVLARYEISEEDVQGPFVDEIPDGFEAMAEMERLAYTGPDELLAEKFHMHIDALKSLNPGADFSQAGTEIVVAAVGEEPADSMGEHTGDDGGEEAREDQDGDSDGSVVRIEVDKEMEQVRGYDSDDRLLVAYPATVGSLENPSPSGTTEVVVVVSEPEYSYHPDSDVEGPDEPLQLPPGPNGPVGSIWIDLDKEGYGIHGTPDPAQIRREQSHGCVRLTNWDAEELADLVEAGTEVEFLDRKESDN